MIFWEWKKIFLLTNNLWIQKDIGMPLINKKKKKKNDLRINSKLFNSKSKTPLKIYWLNECQFLIQKQPAFSKKIESVDKFLFENADFTKIIQTFFAYNINNNNKKILVKN